VGNHREVTFEIPPSAGGHLANRKPNSGALRGPSCRRHGRGRRALVLLAGPLLASALDLCPGIIFP
jgi:hypothetical protein